MGKPADEHRTGAAVALGTAFLGAGEAALQPQIIQQCRCRGNIGKGDLCVVQDEADAVGCLFHAIPLPSVVDYCAVHPPSIETCVPVIWEASSLAR